MHDLLEEVAPLEIELLLSQYVRHRLIRLDDFGHTETDKPVLVLSRVFQADNSIRASASQMLQLIRILAFVVGDVIPRQCVLALLPYFEKNS